MIITSKSGRVSGQQVPAAGEFDMQVGGSKAARQQSSPVGWSSRGSAWLRACTIVDELVRHLGNAECGLEVGASRSAGIRKNRNKARRRDKRALLRRQRKATVSVVAFAA